MDPPFFLHSLPESILVEALHKMTNVQIYRMRRTCSYVNDIVEANRRKLANRPKMGCEVSIGYLPIKDPNPEMLELKQGKLVVTIENENGTSQRFEDDYEFMNRLTAMAISHLVLVFGGSDSLETENKVLAEIRRCHIMCETALFLAVFMKNMIEFSNCVVNRQQMDIQLKKADFNDENIRMLLSALKENPRRTTFCITINDLTVCKFEGLMDLLKPFRFIRFDKCRTDSFHEFVKEIVKLPWVIPTKRFFFEFMYTTIDSEPFRPFQGPGAIPLTKIWDIHDLPNDGTGSAPMSLRLLNLPKNYVVVAEKKTKWHWKLEMYFIPKRVSHVLFVVANELKLGPLSPAFRKAFYTTSAECKQKMLLAMYKNKQTRKRKANEELQL